MLSSYVSFALSHRYSLRFQSDSYGGSHWRYEIIGTGNDMLVIKQHAIFWIISEARQQWVNVQHSSRCKQYIT